MASTMGSGSAVPPSEWHSTDIHARTHLTACLRAGVIALVLLAVLAVIVLF